MKCFYSQTDAIGICRSCGRGLSLEFATEYPKGLACKSRCEEDVEALIAMVDRSTKISATSASIVRSNWVSVLVSAVFLLILGVGFFYETRGREGFDLGRFLAVSFSGYGCYLIYRAIKIRAAASEKPV